MSMRMSSWGAEPVPSIRRTCSSTSTGASSFTYGESGEGFCWATEVRLRVNDNDKDNDKDKEMRRIVLRLAISMIRPPRNESGFSSKLHGMVPPPQRGSWPKPEAEVRGPKSGARFIDRSPPESSPVP